MNFEILRCLGILDLNQRQPMHEGGSDVIIQYLKENIYTTHVTPATLHVILQLGGISPNIIEQVINDFHCLEGPILDEVVNNFLQKTSDLEATTNNILLLHSKCSITMRERSNGQTLMTSENNTNILTVDFDHSLPAVSDKSTQCMGTLEFNTKTRCCCLTSFF